VTNSREAVSLLGVARCCSTGLSRPTPSAIVSSIVPQSLQRSASSLYSPRSPVRFQMGQSSWEHLFIAAQVTRRSAHGVS
jgi:hypothetical protein